MTPSGNTRSAGSLLAPFDHAQEGIEPMMSKFAAAAVVAAGLVSVPSVASAAPSGSISPTQVSSAGQDVTVSFSGLKANTSLIVMVCRDNPVTDPTFNVGVDCSSNSTDPTAQTGTGSGTFVYSASSGSSTGIVVGAKPDDPSDFACLAPGAPVPTQNAFGNLYSGGTGGVRSGQVDGQGHIVAGVGNGKVCYIRVTDDSPGNATDQFFVPYNVVKSGGGGGTTTTTAGGTTTTAHSTTTAGGGTTTTAGGTTTTASGTTTTAGGTTTTAAGQTTTTNAPPSALADFPWAVAAPIVALGALVFVWTMLRRRRAA